MKLLLLFILLEYSDFAPLPAADANAKFSQADLSNLREASILRGNYKDVARSLMEHFYPQQEPLFFGYQVLIIVLQEIYSTITLQTQTFIKDMLLSELVNHQQWNFYKHIKSILQGFGFGTSMIENKTCKSLQQELIERLKKSFLMKLGPNLMYMFKNFLINWYQV
ncbi:unnamed protein product [Paramecium octaurelia]|uniref:Uncharacterized protein n=1 Tax=Paramecium octaurelia TaxID=43137 RepID=A0A8S1YIT5_PAROT|nr:unnamed protein product [Paramecium octaurelia]